MLLSRMGIKIMSIFEFIKNKKKVTHNGNGFIKFNTYAFKEVGGKIAFTLS